MTQEQKRLNVTFHAARSIHNTPTNLSHINIQVKILASEIWGLSPMASLSAHLTQLWDQWNYLSGSPSQHSVFALIQTRIIWQLCFFFCRVQLFFHHLFFQEQQRETPVRWDCDRPVVDPRTEHWSPQQLCHTGCAHKQSNYFPNSAKPHSHQHGLTALEWIYSITNMQCTQALECSSCHLYSSTLLLYTKLTALMEQLLS